MVMVRQIKSLTNGFTVNVCTHIERGLPGFLWDISFVCVCVRDDPVLKCQLILYVYYLLSMANVLIWTQS